MIFSISSDNDVMTHDVAPEAQEGKIVFASQKELAAATAGWPSSRYLEVWNGFAGTPGPFAKLKEIRKFTDRKTAINRIWGVLQALTTDGSSAPEKAQETPTKEVATALPADKGNAPKATKRPRKPNVARQPRSRPRLPPPRAMAARRPR